MERKLNIVFPVGKKPNIVFFESEYADKDCYVFWDMDYLKVSPSWLPEQPIKHKEVFAINGMQERIENLKRDLAKALEALRKCEKVIRHTYEICLCERFKTEGFDYHEQHPARGAPNGGSRPFTPKDFIENVIGFRWKYDDNVKPYRSWKELDFSIIKELGE